jgi:hypothetical protein
MICNIPSKEDIKVNDGNELVVEADQKEDLKPKPPAKLAPQGIRTFTVFRGHDETGVSGDGIVIEGVELATGQCIAHWLYPPPRGSIAVFDSINDFIKVHIRPHPTNQTIITYEDGEQQTFKPENEEVPEKSLDKSEE